MGPPAARGVHLAFPSSCRLTRQRPTMHLESGLITSKRSQSNGVRVKSARVESYASGVVYESPNRDEEADLTANLMADARACPTDELLSGHRSIRHRTESLTDQIFARLLPSTLLAL